MTRRPRGGWPESSRHDCQQLRQTQHGFGRRAPDRHRLRASSVEWSWKTCPACRTPNAGCTGAAIGSARLRGLLGVRVSQPDVTAPSPRPACSRARGLFRSLAAAARSPDHRAGLFGATFSDGKANRARPRPKNGQRCSSRRAGTCSAQQTAAPIAVASGANDGIEYVLRRRT
jgi:hypothetical protein